MIRNNNKITSKNKHDDKNHGLRTKTLLTARCSLLTVLLFTVLCSLFIVLSCPNSLFEKIDDPSPANENAQNGMGNLTLYIGDITARTILPNPGLSDFKKFRLVFTHSSNPAAFNRENTLSSLTSSETYSLAEGDWNLIIYCYIDIDDEEPAAAGDVDFTITQGETTNAGITLSADILEEGEGIFEWSITAGVMLANPENNPVKITITKDGASTPAATVNNLSGTKELENGYYIVHFEITNSTGQKASWIEVTGIYRNLTSSYSKTLSAANYFSNLPDNVEVTVAPSATGEGPWVNAELKATVANLPATGTVTYQWWRGDTCVKTEIGTTSTYTVQMSDYECELTVKLNVAGYNGTRSSAAILINQIGIYNEAQLKLVGTDDGTPGGSDDGYTLARNYILAINISLTPPSSPTGSNWTPIGNDTNRFTGIFDGNGKIITGLIINSSSSYQGLFGYIEGGTVKNVGIVGTSVTGGGYTGGIVGNNNGGTISGCFFSGEVKSIGASAPQTGGIAGWSNGVISNCYNTGNIESSDSNVGGIVGRTATPGTVTNCYNTGNVTAKGSIGGIVGYGNTVINCVSLGLFMTSDGGSFPLRIRGAADGGSLSNNYAREDMMRNGNFAPSGAHDDASGASITLVDCNNETWWKTASNWSTTSPATAWNFDNVWEWGSKNLPILRGFAAGTQNHELPSHSSKTLTVTPSAGGTVNINAGGSPVSSGAQVVNGASVVLTATANTGYTFMDWTIDSAPAGLTLSPNNTANPATFSMPDNNVSVTANFTANTYAVTFNENYGTTPATQTRTVTYDSTYDAATGGFPTATRTGYTFAGWWTEQTTGGVRVFGTDTVKITAAQILYARWSVGNYNVTINTATGGTAYVGASGTSTSGLFAFDSDVTIRATANTGYTFEGWTVTSNNVTPVPTAATATFKMPASDVTITPVFTANTYTVTFNKNNSDAGSTEASPQTINVTTPATTVGTLPTPPTRTGYSFVGWYDTQAATGGTQFTALTTVTASRTVWARWAQNYTVTFNKNHNDASGFTEANPATKTVEYPATTVGTLPTPPTRTGYTFAGWFDTQAASGGTQFTASITVNSTRTVYARWNPINYTVTYNANGGTPTTSQTRTVTYDSTYGAATGGIPTATRTGYTFAGWWTEQTTGGTQVLGTDTVKITANQTLYARWTPITYIVRYDSNGASGTMADSTFTYDSATNQLRPNTFTRTGYDFIGWSIASGTQTVVYADEATITTNLSSTQGAVVNIYAQWRNYEVTGTISSNIPGGALEGATVQLKSGTTDVGSPVTTDASGAFTISGVPSGTYTIAVSAIGYATGTIASFEVNGADVTGRTATLNVKNIGYLNPITAQGRGSNSNPFLISSVDDLVAMRIYVNSSSTYTYDGTSSRKYSVSYFRVTSPIDLSVIANWTPIGVDAENFAGNFNGQGYTISNLYINTTDEKQGLFGSITATAEIYNIGLVNANITITGENGYAGGIAAYSRGKIYNCYNTGGSVTANYVVGGIVGEMDGGEVKNCYNTSSVTGTLEKTGGITGQLLSNGLIENCYNTGSIDGGAYTGGILGCFYAGTVGTVRNCVSLGAVIDGTSNTTNQILGGRSGSGGTLTNNLSRNGMKINGNPTTGGGANIASGMGWGESSFTGDTLWNYANFNFTTHWNTPYSPSNRLPTLKLADGYSFPSSTIQNPTVPPVP